MIHTLTSPRPWSCSECTCLTLSRNTGENCFERLVRSTSTSTFPRINLVIDVLIFILHIRNIRNRLMFSAFRSIFSDDTDHVISINEDKFENRLLFTSWISRKVQQFLKILADDLEVIIASDWFTLNIINLIG